MIRLGTEPRRMAGWISANARLPTTPVGTNHGVHYHPRALCAQLTLSHEMATGPVAQPVRVGDNHDDTSRHETPPHGGVDSGAACANHLSRHSLGEDGTTPVLAMDCTSRWPWPRLSRAFGDVNNAPSGIQHAPFFLRRRAARAASASRLSVPVVGSGTTVYT